MPGGRKRKPSHLKAVQGTDRKDRANPAEPEPSADAPEEVPLLDDRAEWWFRVLSGRVVEIGVGSKSHSEALALAAMRAAEVEALNEVIQSEGPTYETTTQAGGLMIRSHPAVSQRSEAMRHLQSLLAEFGLTPASMSKVSARNKEPEDDEWQRLQAL